MKRTAADRQKGSALILALILGAVLASSAALALAGALEAGRELRARRDVLCARYAAISGLVLDPGASAEIGGSGGWDELEVVLSSRSPGWCVRRAYARCGSARRRAELTAEDPGLCK